MGKLIRAVFGLVVALALLSGEGFWARLRTTSFLAVKADISAQKPGIRLESSLDGWMSSRNGTHLAQKPRGL